MFLVYISHSIRVFETNYLLPPHINHQFIQSILRINYLYPPHIHLPPHIHYAQN